MVQDNNIKMYSTHNEGKSIVAERFTRTLKNKIYKFMTSISKNVYFEKLHDIIDKFNNTYHSTMKMKSTDVKSSTYIDLNVEKMMKILNLKFVIMQQYQNTKTFLKKATLQIGLKKFGGVFQEKELERTNQTEFRVEKVMKRKSNKVYVKWKDYDLTVEECMI